jgi:uncharacterized protein (DUF362 family)/Pyruvate/2-oxoacid:ferredoxin oxidoreductase delta subunit
MSRVYIARCPDYEPRNVEAALQASLQALLGGQPLLRPGQRVILKANLLQAQPPEKAITTHPTLVAAVAKWVRNAGAIPIIADSPGGLFNTRVLRQVYDATGMTAAAAESGAILNYDVGTRRVSCPAGRATKTLDALRAVVEADAIISLPKLKTHGLVQFTGATKNLFGTVPGIIKTTYHARFPMADSFSAMLIDILTYYKPVLTIMDAVVGMEGDGPSAGNPRHIGLLLASTDGVALDVVATSLIGMSPWDVPPLAAAARRGLTTGRVEDIEILGSSLEAVRVAGFQKPRTGGRHVRMVPHWVPNWITNQLLANPQAGDKCIACGVCVQNCPVQAITIVNGRARTDLKRCIHCYCCHELCPEDAVHLTSRRFTTFGRLEH